MGNGVHNQEKRIRARAAQMFAEMLGQIHIDKELLIGNDLQSQEVETVFHTRLTIDFHYTLSS